jgi:hypothetical protein
MPCLRSDSSAGEAAHVGTATPAEPKSHGNVGVC